jgi:hypothetical protein
MIAPIALPSTPSPHDTPAVFREFRRPPFPGLFPANVAVCCLGHDIAHDRGRRFSRIPAPPVGKVRRRLIASPWQFAAVSSPPPLWGRQRVRRRRTSGGGYLRAATSNRWPSVSMDILSVSVRPPSTSRPRKMNSSTDICGSSVPSRSGAATWLASDSFVSAGAVETAKCRTTA